MKSHSSDVLAGYSVKKVSWILGVPTSVVARGVRQGWIPAVRRRGHLLIPASDVVRLLGGEAVTGGGAR
jgi:hypothetical protein